jgi:CBS domain-containing protein
MTVADLMNCDVVTVTPETSVRELARVLYEHCISGVPVLEDGRVIGVASSTDVLWLSTRAATSPDPPPPDFDVWRGLDEFRVREIMTPDVFSVEPSMDVAALRRFFVRTGVHRALVLDDGVLVGIVSVSDLLGVIAQSKTAPA